MSSSMQQKTLVPCFTAGCFFKIVAFSARKRIMREGSTNHYPPQFFFFCFLFFLFFFLRWGVGGCFLLLFCFVLHFALLLLLGSPTPLPPSFFVVVVSRDQFTCTSSILYDQYQSTVAERTCGGRAFPDELRVSSFP